LQCFFAIFYRFETNFDYFLCTAQQDFVFENKKAPISGL